MMLSLMTTLWSFIEELDKQSGMDWLPNTDNLQSLLDLNAKEIKVYSELEQTLVGKNTNPIINFVHDQDHHVKVFFGLNNIWIELWLMDNELTVEKETEIQNWEKLSHIVDCNGEKNIGAFYEYLADGAVAEGLIKAVVAPATDDYRHPRRPMLKASTATQWHTAF